MRTAVLVVAAAGATAAVPAATAAAAAAGGASGVSVPLDVSEAVRRGCARRGAGRPGGEGAVRERRGRRAGAGPPRGAAGRREAAVRLGLRRRRRRRQTDRSWCAPRGGLGCAPSSPGLEPRGVALPSWDSGRAGSRLRAPRGGTAAPWTPGNRSRDPGARLPGLPGCDRPRVGVRAPGRLRGSGRAGLGTAAPGEKLDCPGKLLFRDRTGIGSLVG